MNILLIILIVVPILIASWVLRIYLDWRRAQKNYTAQQNINKTKTHDLHMKSTAQLNNQHPEVNVCKGEEKCSKSVGKLTEDITSDIVIRNPPVDTDDLRNPSLDEVTPLEGHRTNPQDDPGKANVAYNGDTGDGTFPADSKLPKGFKEGKCGCGNSYGYCGIDIGYCVKCIDGMETKDENKLD